VVEELCKPLRRPGDENAGIDINSQVSPSPQPSPRSIEERAQETEDFVHSQAAPRTEEQEPEPPPPVRESLVEWLARILLEKRLPTGLAKDWNAFAKRDADLAWAARVFLLRRRQKLPDDVPVPEDDVSPE
jgi:hypothetical protein